MATTEPVTATKREVLLNGTDARAILHTLAPGAAIPWHYHTAVADLFLCLDGPMVVETREPQAKHELTAGEIYVAPPKTPHHAYGKDNRSCRFLVLQGVGAIDYIKLPVDD